MRCGWILFTACEVGANDYSPVQKGEMMMKAIAGKGKQSQNKLQKRRQALLAMNHIALKELNISDEDYRDILRDEFKVASSSALSLPELGRLIERHKSKGWSPKGEGGRAWRPKNTGGQLRVLGERARGLASEIENGAQRLPGLCRKLCGVDKIEWCKDVGKIKGLIAALGKIRDAEKQSVLSTDGSGAM